MFVGELPRHSSVKLRICGGVWIASFLGFVGVGSTAEEAWRALFVGGVS